MTTPNRKTKEEQDIIDLFTNPKTPPMDCELGTAVATKLQALATSRLADAAERIAAACERIAAALDLANC